MKRTKAILIATAGAVALTVAGGAATASAAGIAFGSYPASVEGKVSGTHAFYFSGGRAVGCNLNRFDASVDGPSEKLVATVTPGECSSSYEGKVTLKMNGCKFIYRPAPGEGSFDIGPAGCGPIIMEGAFCTRVFPAQKGLDASFLNQEGVVDTVSIQENASLQYWVTQGTLAYCGSKETPHSASFSGSWIVKGFSGGGEQVDARVVPGTGVYMTGKESAEEAQQPAFAAEGYPVTITGEQDSTQRFALTIGGNRTVECEEVTKHSELAGPAKQLLLKPDYHLCALTILGTTLRTTIQANSCSYVLTADNSGPPYSGTLGVACSKEGDGFEINVYNETEASPICTYKIAPQGGLAGADLSNVGSGTERGVAVDLAVSGLTVSRVHGKLASCGGASQLATYSGSTVLRGVR